MIPTLQLGGLGRRWNQSTGPSGVTLNPSDKDSTLILSNGNLTVTKSGAPTTHVLVRATAGVSSGKVYWEVRQDTTMTNTREIAAITKSSVATNVQPGGVANGIGYNGVNGFLYNQGSGAGWGSTFTTTDVIGIALDMTAGKVWFAKNNVWQASGDPATGANAAVSGLTGTWYPTIGMYDTSGAATARFATAAFTYTPPSGFAAIPYP